MIYLKDCSLRGNERILIDLAMNNFSIKRENLNRILQQGEVLAACDKNKIVGFISYRFISFDRIYINFAVLDKRYQGKGIARSLLPNLIDRAKAKGIRQVYGLVTYENERALQFFTEIGFRPISGHSQGILIGAPI